MSHTPPDREAAASLLQSAPRRTMPPPELLDRSPPASVSQLVLSEIRNEPPLLRHSGPRAELAHQFALAAAAAEAGDRDREREALLSISRILTSRGTELDTATAAARKALSMGDEPALRSELGSWLSGLGEPALAAAALRGLEPARHIDAARNLLKIAVLLGRSGDAAGAADALREVASLEPAEPMAHELLGMLASWAPEDVSPEEAAAAYGAAAALRRAAGDEDAALEDRLRAFEIAPGHEPTARALAEAVAGQSAGAADEVLRAYAGAAFATDPQVALAMHRERMRAAIADGDGARAAGALLDAWLEGDVGGELAEEVDAALLLAGLGEMVAVRLTLDAAEQEGEARAAAYLSLGKLYAGSLASPERAAEAYAEAFVADPRCTEAMTLLAHHADDTHDPWPLVEALVRLGMRPHASYAEPNQGAARVSALQELSALAEDKLADPHLASWALRRLVEAGASSGVGARLDKLSPRLRLQEDAYEQALGRLAAAEEAGERALSLRRALAFYRGRPDEAATYFKLARELLELSPSDAAAADDVARAAMRAGKEKELLEILRADAAARAGRDAAGHARSLMRACALLLRKADEAAILADLTQAIAEAEVHDAVASAAVVHACRARAVKDRAEALGALAGGKRPDVAAVLLAVAGDLWVILGEPERALAVTKRAVSVEPAPPRAIVARAAASLGRADRESVAAVEQAISAVVPRGILCDALAAALSELGERDLAFAWTQRWLALRPASPEVSELLLQRALASGEAQSLADALGAVFAQPRPPAVIADLVADVLDALLEADRAKAAALARRALDVLGPRSPALLRRLLAVAEKAGDAALVITLLERWLATGLAGDESAAATMDLAMRRAAVGDHAAAARLFARAVSAGQDPELVLGALEPLIPEVEARLAEATAGAGALLSDALVFLAEARAMAFASLAEPRPAETSYAYRVWGGLLWDLAADPVGAENAFFQASTLVREGVERYARDMRQFTGPIRALDALESRAAQIAQDPAFYKLRASFLIHAAYMAQSVGFQERALSLAATAIEIDPSRADAVGIVERTAHVEGGLAVLDSTYDRLAGAALGCFGRRAAHYRGARQLERRGAIDLALRHAIESFDAVPVEGTTFLLLSRLAERSADPSEAVRALTRVAERSDPAVRPAWLRRAAAIAGRSEEGLRTRFDILLRALLARPDLEAIRDVSSALRDLVAATGDHETPALRLDRAVRALLPKLDGPDGARAGVQLARLAVESLHDLPLGLDAVARAAAADGDVEDFLQLADLVPRIAADPALAARLCDEVQAAAVKPYSSVGPSLLRFASTVAEAAGDAYTAAALLVEAARRAPEEDDLVYRADAAVVATGGAELVLSLDQAVPPPARVEALLRVAEKLEHEGKDAAAIEVLSRVLLLGPEGPEARERAVAWARRLHAMAGKPESIQELLRAELARGDLRPAARERYARDLGAILSGRGHHKRALEALADGLAGAHLEEDGLADLRRFGRRARDAAAVREALAKLLDAAPDEETRALLERELDAAEAAPAAEVVDGPPSIVRTAIDAQVLETMEQEANRRGDHAAVADFLEKRISLAEVPDVRRMLRLRRVAVLEQRLGRIADAAAELSAQLAETPDDVIALRYLGDVRERTGDPVGAAELWERLAQIAPTTDEKAEYGLRAASNLILGGELARAREALDRFAAMAPRESVVELRAQIARKEGDFTALSSALDQLASSSREPPSRRAELLLEASRAAAAIGDDAGSLERARRAVRLVPDQVEAILEVLRAEYRLRGPGTPREAQAAVAELQRIAERVPPQHVDLHAFLLAEEIDVIQGGGAGMRELSLRHAEVGPLSLIALGMAERLVRSKTFDPAVSLFETALAGDLRGLRARGRVALAAAEAAAVAGDTERARNLLQIAASEPETRPLALRREAELARLAAEVGAGPPPPRAAAGPPPLPPEAHPLPVAVPAPPPAEPAPPSEALSAPRSNEPAPSSRMDELDPPDLDQELATMVGAPAIDADEIAVRRALEAAEAAFPSPRFSVAESDDAHLAPPTARAAASPPAPRALVPPPLPGSSRPPPLPGGPPPLPESSRPPPVPGGPPPLPEQTAPALAEVPADVAVVGAPPQPAPGGASPAQVASSVAVSAPQVASGVAVSAPQTASGVAVSAPQASAGAAVPPPLPAPNVVVPPPLPTVAFHDADSDELALRRELLAGSFEAGEQLIGLYAADAAGRTRDILAVRRQQAAIRTGDLISLARLHEAAALDGNAPFANAVEHVLGVFDSSGGLAPPPLSAQRDAPALVSSLLFRQVDSLVNEALAIVWETGLYRRETASYGLTGVERVQPNAATQLGEIFANLLRLFGLGRVWLFHRRTPGPVRAEVALLASPSVVLTGEIGATDTGMLLYHLGSHLTGAMPEHALVNGMPEDELRTLIDALVAAFGPLDAAPRGNRAVVRLEQSLWQLIPPRAERRLREICAHPQELSYEAAVRGTRQAMRRAGLFASGSLSTAVRLAAEQAGYDLEPLRAAPDGLERACLDNPEIADLVRLAIRTEYAEARWLPPRSEGQGPESRRSRYV